MFYKTIAFALLIGFVGVSALAQNAPNAGDHPIDGAKLEEFVSRLTQFQRQQLDDIKVQLGATDTEFKVLQPWLQKIIDAQMDLKVSRSTATRGASGGLNPEELQVMMLVQPPTPLQLAFTALRQVLEDPRTPEQIVSAKLRTVREARAKVLEGMAAAQNELIKLLTLQQEAILVSMGYLD